MKKKAKKDKRKSPRDPDNLSPIPEDYACDVVENGKRCGDTVYLGWGVLGHTWRICAHHWYCHCDDNIDFDLHDVFGLPRLNSVETDQFGFAKPYDHPDLNGGKIPDYPGFKTKKKATRDKNPGAKYYSKPTKRIVTKRTVKVTQEKNDVFDDILNMEL